jgi:hypothetical protein
LYLLLYIVSNYGIHRDGKFCGYLLLHKFKKKEKKKRVITGHELTYSTGKKPGKLDILLK